MDVSVGSRWENFVTALVDQGRYDSASDVVLEGLRLVEEREAKLADLKATIAAAIAEGGDYSGEEVMAAVDAEVARLANADF